MSSLRAIFIIFITIQRVRSFYSTELNGPVLVSTAASLFADTVYQNKDRLSVGLIIGGWDPIKGGSVYSVAMGGAVFFLPPESP
jgi:20S proteasome alpha/beta subunit